MLTHLFLLPIIMAEYEVKSRSTFTGSKGKGRFREEPAHSSRRGAYICA
jgi:hypothetical protein